MCPVTLSLILFCWRSLPPHSVTDTDDADWVERCAAHLMLQIKPARWNRKKRLCLCSRCGFQNKTNAIPPHCNDAKVNKKKFIKPNWGEHHAIYRTWKKNHCFFFSLLSWKLTSSLLFKPSCWSFYFESNDSAGQSNLTHLPSYNRSSITEDSELGQKTSGDCKNNI